MVPLAGSLATTAAAKNSNRPAEMKVTWKPAKMEMKPDAREPARVATPMTALYTPRAEPAFPLWIALNIMVYVEM